MAPVDLELLGRRIKYQFNNIKFLKQALTHCSFSSEANNERFEFLGDSILSFVIAHALFELFPNQSEGQLSRLRAHLVKGETLAEIAVELNLGDFLFLGQGELKSGGFRRASILADALEALIAAVYLDGGLQEAQELILKLYKKRLASNALQNNLKDPKTQLQELLQGFKKPLPEYSLSKVEGEEHEQIFYILCSVKGFPDVTEGMGHSRRKAEQEAAQKFLKLIKTDGSVD